MQVDEGVADEQADPHHLDLLHGAVPGADGQRDLPAVLAGRRAQQGRPQPADHPGGVLPRARRDPGRPRTRWPRAWRPTTSTSSSAPTPSRSSTPRSPAGSPTTPRPASSRARTTCCPATTRGCSSTAWSTWSTATTPRAAGVSLTLDPAAQTAAFDGLRALGRRRAGRRRGDRAVDRQDPGHGVAADVRPEPAGLPRLRVGLGELRPAQRRPRQAAAQPRHPDHAAAGVDVQARHRGRRDRERQLGRLARRCRPGRPTSCPRPTVTPA